MTGFDLILSYRLLTADRDIIWFYPHNNARLPQSGVISTRSPDLPNPIWMHSICFLFATPVGWLMVSGDEGPDHTALIDIKHVL